MSDKLTTEKYIKKLAAENHVAYIKSDIDVLAKKFTELSGDEVVTDEIDDLFVALKRAGIITGAELVNLLGQYIDEKRDRNDNNNM